MIPEGQIQFPDDCEKMIRSLWEYIDSELDEAEAAEVEQHLELCSHCRDHTDFERALREKIATLGTAHSNPEGLRTRVMAALRTAQEAEGIGGSD